MSNKKIIDPSKDKGSKEVEPVNYRKARNATHNLDLGIKGHQEIFDKTVRLIIEDHEGVRYKSYRDVKGKVTVGIGFNMNHVDARKEWDEAFKDSPTEEKPDFDKVYRGEVNLKDEQAGKLYKIVLNNRINQIKSIYGKDEFESLRPNEQLAIISLGYNSIGKLVGENTMFKKIMKKYIETKDERYLLLAVEEVAKRSNRDKIKGVQNRRNKEAELLNSTLCPCYTKPGQPPMPENLSPVVLGVTVIPREITKNLTTRGITKSFAESCHEKYLIWRTQMDGKVRPEHAEREGKVFLHDDKIFEDLLEKNCRCYKEALPIQFKISETKQLRVPYVNDNSPYANQGAMRPAMRSAMSPAMRPPKRPGIRIGRVIN